MKTRFLFSYFVVVLISACAGTQPAAIQSPTTPLPTFTATNTFPPQQLSTFPYAPMLNEALPKENLILAAHVYADATCYDVGVYSDDSYTFISCLPDFTYPAPVGALDANQSKYLRRWVRTFQSFEDPTNHGLLKFNGTGTAIPEFPDRISTQAMLGDLEWIAHGYIHRGGTPSAVLLARSVLSNQLNLPLDDSSILKFEVADFPDACLGAPKPGETCEPVITQGFRIYLVANNLMYEYHTDTFGYDIRPIGEPQIAPTQGAGG